MDRVGMWDDVWERMKESDRIGRKNTIKNDSSSSSSSSSILDARCSAAQSGNRIAHVTLAQPTAVSRVVWGEYLTCVTRLVCAVDDRKRVTNAFHELSTYCVCVRAPSLLSHQLREREHQRLIYKIQNEKKKKKNRLENYIPSMTRFVQQCSSVVASKKKKKNRKDLLWINGRLGRAELGPEIVWHTKTALKTLKTRQHREFPFFLSFLLWFWSW